MKPKGKDQDAAFGKRLSAVLLAQEAFPDDKVIQGLPEKD